MYVYIYKFTLKLFKTVPLSRVDIYNMDGKPKNVKQRKRKPGKRSVLIFCNKTNADGVSLH